MRIRSRPEMPRPAISKSGDGQPRDPDNGPQQAEPHQHGGDQPDATRASLLVLGQLARQNRDEDDVVDPEDDLEKCQSDEGDGQFHERSWNVAYSTAIGS